MAQPTALSAAFPDASYTSQPPITLLHGSYEGAGAETQGIQRHVNPLNSATASNSISSNKRDQLRGERTAGWGGGYLVNSKGGIDSGTIDGLALLIQAAHGWPHALH